MTAIQISWLISAVVLLIGTIAVGSAITRRPLGVLIDSRGRYSLTHFQLTVWTIVVISLIAGVFFGRWVAGAANPLEFTIPTEVLALMGISLGSTALTTVVKASNDQQRPGSVAASMDDASGMSGGAQSTVDRKGVDAAWKSRFSQVFLQEEGSYANKVVDIAKYQQFIITIVLVAAYTGLAIHAVGGNPADVTALPKLGSTFLVLLAASHGTYIAGKMPTQTGSPELTVVSRNQMVESARAQRMDAAQVVDDQRRVADAGTKQDPVKSAGSQAGDAGFEPARGLHTTRFPSLRWRSGRFKPDRKAAITSSATDHEPRE